MITTSLPKAPSAVVGPDGSPHCGKFAGFTGPIDWRGLRAPHARGALWRRLHHKRWQYASIATPELFCAAAIVDLGWTNAAFAYAFDRLRGAIVASFSQSGVPGLTARVSDRPAQGAASHFALFGKHLHYYRLADRPAFRLTLRAGDFEIDAELDAAHAPPFLLAVGPVARGAVHATQKSPGLPVSGLVRAGGAIYGLAGGVGSIDYSNGLLARETDWRWASAHTTGFGFNLQQGYFGPHENALWVGGRLVPLGAARFEFERADPLAPWRIQTDDGQLDLRFVPQGARREDRRLLIAASRYVQPLGTFSGWVRAEPDGAPIEVDRLFGVTEDHYARW